MNATNKVKVGAYEIDAPAVGSILNIDGGKFGRPLIPCECPEFAPFRLHSESMSFVQGRPAGRAVTVEVTGRTLQRREGREVVRVEVRVLGIDDEADEVLRGYLNVSGAVWVG